MQVLALILYLIIFFLTKAFRWRIVSFLSLTFKFAHTVYCFITKWVIYCAALPSSQEVKKKRGSLILISRWGVYFLCCLYFPLTKMQGVIQKLSTHDISELSQSPSFLTGVSPMVNLLEFANALSLRI